MIDILNYKFMSKVAISSKFQIVIPKPIRETMRIKVGMVLHMIPYADRIELIPIRPIKELRGILADIDTNIIRDKDRI